MKNLSLTTNIIKYVLVVLGVLAAFFVLMAPSDLMDQGQEAVAKFRDGGKMGFSIGYTVTIFVICLAVVLVFFLVQMISNPKKTVMSIVGVLAAVVVYFVFRMKESSDTVQSLGLEDTKILDGLSDGAIQSTITSTTAGIYTVLFAVAIAFLTVLFFFVKSTVQRLK
ncbi:MAG: hypothetical protein MK066_03370 [Crocinitomicaceae bacterium]|nr:hypothetical protein [Crocinitomicaceae bacterium]